MRQLRIAIVEIERVAVLVAEEESGSLIERIAWPWVLMEDDGRADSTECKGFH
jgi:hypothetical protein